MKQLFKTTLLAATIAATSTAAVAGDMNVTTNKYSSQGLSLLASTATVTAPVATYTVLAGYALDDLISVRVTKGALASTYSWPTTLPFTPNSTASTTRSMTVEFLSTETNTAGDTIAKYRVTGLGPNTVTIAGTTTSTTTRGGHFTLPAFTLNASVVAATDVEVEISSELSNGVTKIDTNSSVGKSRVGKFTDAVDQFGDMTLSTVFNAVIDVAESRKKFSNKETSDTLTWAATDLGSTLNNAIATSAATTSVTINGDFEGMANTAFTSANGGVAAYDNTAKKVVVTYPTTVTNDTITVTNSTVVMKAQTFTVEAARNYSTKVEALGSASAGEWKLNGAVVNIPYMPYGPSVSQIMYVSNAGAQAGDILVTAFDEAGVMYDLGVVAQAKGKTVTKLTSLIKTALKGKGFTDGKLSITVTVNAPSADVTVYASYAVGSADRGFVNTDQYKGMK